MTYELHLGDCLEYMKSMSAGSVDAVITSPPYNVGINYGDGQVNDSLPYEEYLCWLDKVWHECWRVLCDGGRLCINVNDTGRNPYFPVHADISTRLRISGWYFMGIIIWHKGTSMGNTAWGSWESASCPSLRGQHEYIIVVGKGGKQKPPRIPGSKSGPYFIKDGTKEFLSLTNEMWKFTPETDSEHPAPFPYELPSRLIRLFTFAGDVVLDPFCGSGTTLRAALDYGRDGIGIDVVEKYIEMSRIRLSQKPMFDGDIWDIPSASKNVEEIQGDLL
jgi:DNA modification methylase